MSTNAHIIRPVPEIGDDLYQVIYVHWNGYPEGVGKTLLEHYTDPDKIDRLFELGDMSYLGYETDPIDNHTFDKPEKYVCIFYTRDRDEDWDDNKPKLVSEQELEKSWLNEWNYMYKNGQWYYRKETWNSWKKLTPSAVGIKTAVKTK